MRKADKKKLTLNATTIALLTDLELDRAAGAGSARTTGWRSVVLTPAAWTTIVMGC
jgi:hypothetical protein